MKTNRYIIAAAGTLLLMLLGTFYAWSLFRVYIAADFPGWTAADLSMNFTLLVVVFCFGSLYAGKSKKSRPYIMKIAAVLMLAGLLGVSFIPALDGASGLVLLYVFYGGLCGFGVGMAYNTILSGVSRWFPKTPGLISGLLLMGYGLGSLVCGSGLSAIADRVGIWTAFRIAAPVLGCAVFLGSWLFRQEPAAAAASGGETGITTGEMMKTPSFWFMFLWALFTGCVGLMVINSAAGIALSFGVAAALGLLVSLFNGFGRVVSGLVYDRLRFNSIFLVLAVALGSGALMVTAHGTGSGAVMMAGMLLAGLSYGSSMAVIAALIRDCFGMKHYSSNFAVVTMAGIPSSFLGPFVSGMLQDASGGDYLTTFCAMLVFGLLGLICGIGGKLCRKREKCHD